MTKRPRAEHLRTFDAWAHSVDADDLVAIDSSALQCITRLADQRSLIEAELAAAVVAARSAGHSWSQIAVMLGVSKQAAQQRYGKHVPAA